jgi:hypothetical protein
MSTQNTYLYYFKTCKLLCRFKPSCSLLSRTRAYIFLSNKKEEVKKWSSLPCWFIKHPSRIVVCINVQHSTDNYIETFSWRSFSSRSNCVIFYLAIAYLHSVLCILNAFFLIHSISRIKTAIFISFTAAATGEQLHVYTSTWNEIFFNLYSMYRTINWTINNVALADT